MKQTMKKNKLIFSLLLACLLIGPIACEKELDVQNPNSPTLLGSVVDEEGLISFIQGATYNNGFSRGAGWLGNSYFSLPWGYHELLADNVGASAANNQITNIGQPLSVKLDNGTVLTNPTSQKDIIRIFNNRASTGAGNNALFYQWSNMYALNNGCNQILANVDRIPFSGDKTTKVNTIKAWCYWWKGYAYAAIGSFYVAGVIADDVSNPTALNTTISNTYVSKEAIIANSNRLFDLAKTTLQGVTNNADYSEILGKMIPDFCQVGKGGVLTTAMWIRNINTMLARNILVNKLSPFVNSIPTATITKSLMTTMTATDWNSIITLTTAGVQAGDLIFTARSTSVSSNTIFTANSGNVAANTATNASTATFKISERFLQYFRVGDQRFANNFNTSSTYTDNYVYSTRYTLVNNGLGLSGVKVLASRTAGAYEVVIAGSYEENALMLAEANIRTGNINAGLTLIDQVRTSQGAGLAALTPGLTLVQALNELISERRLSLVFRGLSFYDNRRWGWSYDKSLGGGVFGQFIRNGGTNYTNCEVNYNFMDFWDVPADEIVLNPPSASSVPVVNPNY
jgi:starch-binding outer membrane protein, SusD/RagB family